MVSFRINVIYIADTETPLLNQEKKACLTETAQKMIQISSDNLLP